MQATVPPDPDACEKNVYMGLDLALLAPEAGPVQRMRSFTRQEHTNLEDSSLLEA